MNVIRHIAVIDPAGHTPELDCFNHMVHWSPVPLHYHLPALHGLDSLQTTLGQLAGIVILGSSTSVYDEPEWQKPLFDWVWEKAESNVPVLGICYGHQMIAHGLGGEVAFIDSRGKVKQTGFREISVDSFPGRDSAQKGPMVVSHREIVTRLPKDFLEIGRSEAFKNEVARHKALPVWMLQPHPEATCTFLSNQNIPQPEQASEFKFGHEFMSAFLHFAASY